MLRLLAITGSSLSMAFAELWKNKLRTFLSLFGVTIGVFCIISVLATVSSLKSNIDSSLKNLGTNTIYIDKWEWGGGGPSYPRWKFAQRPVMEAGYVNAIKRQTGSAQHVAMEINAVTQAEFADKTLSGTIVYGVTDDFGRIQPLNIAFGRGFTDADFSRGTQVAVIGEEIANKLFGRPEVALGKTMLVFGRPQAVVGVIKKQGGQLVGGWQFDKSVILSFRNARNLMDERKANPLIMVKGKEGVSSKVLKDELTGVMRSVRRLSPRQEDNFALNDVNDLSKALEQAFASINVGGWAIGVLAFVVGIFGVANIMFVTVKERTPQIGLKKALGAKKKTILLEFLMESAFLCIIGGLIGLALVFALTKIATALLDFPFFLSLPIMLLAIFICVVAGIVAGIVPATQAARMDPVVAIRNR